MLAAACGDGIDADAGSPGDEAEGALVSEAAQLDPAAADDGTVDKAAFAFQHFSAEIFDAVQARPGNSSEACFLVSVRGRMQTADQAIHLKPVSNGWTIDVVNLADTQGAASARLEAVVYCVPESSMKEGTHNIGSYKRVGASSSSCSDELIEFEDNVGVSGKSFFHAVTSIGGKLDAGNVGKSVRVHETSVSGAFLTILRRGGTNPCFVHGFGTTYAYPGTTGNTTAFTGPFGTGGPDRVGDWEVRTNDSQNVSISLGVKATTHVCFLTQIGGNFLSRNESVGLTTVNPGVWFLQASSGRGGSTVARARCVPMVQ